MTTFAAFMMCRTKGASELKALPSTPRTSAVIVRHAARVLAGLLLFASGAIEGQPTGEWHRPKTAPATQASAQSADVERVATPESTPIAHAAPYESMVGDDDGFGFGRGWMPPSSCDTFDNRGPEDLGVFDQRQPGSARDSICNFSGSWTHTFTPPPGGAASLGISMRILGGQGSTAYCWASPCGCVPPAHKVFINGVEYPFFSDPGCARITTWGMGWTGPEAAAMAASGSLNVMVVWGQNGFAIDYAEVTMLPAVEVAAEDGNGQRGVIGNPVEKRLAVKVTSPDPSFNVAGVAVAFEIVSAPSRASGQAVGADDNATTTTYSVMTDANGIARATLVLGDKPGTYSIRVKSPRSLTGATADFSATAIKPASVAILKDSLDPAYKASAYAIRSDAPTSFYMAGFDAQGAMIGPIKAGWGTAGGGSPSTRGSGTALPDANTISTVFTPAGVGHVLLSADPVVGGISTIKADVFITRLYVSVQNNFVPSTPEDDSAKFVPGMYLDGTNVALNVVETTGQFISLHLLTGGAKGKATFSVDSTSYPGIAMNYPLNGDASKDMQFTNGLQSITVDFNPSTGDTWATLLIRDFGASGTINVSITSGKPTYSLPPLRLPVDTDSNGLPDVPWKVGANVINPAGLTATFDEDDDGNASTPHKGDGLSAFEEMRGIVIANAYTRLDPRRRDFFIVADPGLLAFGSPNSNSTPLSYLTPLPLWNHYLELEDVAGEDFVSRGLTKIKPVVNPNRAGVPGARANGQRALRVIRQALFYPAVTIPIPGTPPVEFDIAIWQHGVFGATVLDTNDFERIDRDRSGNPVTVYNAQSPNETAFVEWYAKTFENAGVHTDFMDGLLYGYHDENGDLVPACISPTDVNCDIWEDQLIVPRELPGGYLDELHTVPEYAGDFYTRRAFTCADIVNDVAGGMSLDAFTDLKAAVVAHEVGHGLHLDHDVFCGAMMFDATILGMQRTMSDIIPIPTAFSLWHRDAIRLK